MSLNPQQELGWTTVHKVRHIPEDCFRVPEQFEIMQWHSETFELPKGAIHLAENAACRNQLYQLGKNVLGFQFHPEITPHSLQLFLQNEEEISQFSGKSVQDMQQLKNSMETNFIQGNQILKQAIQYVLAKTV